MNKSFQKFIILWLGQFLSAIGSGMSAFGLSIFIFQKTGLNSATTLITMLAFLPTLLLSPFAGVLADRYDRRLLMILGDGLSTIGLIYILFALRLGDIAIWQIGVGVLASAVFSSLLEPSYRATLTDMLQPQDYTKASGMMQLANVSKYLISPIIAGFLLKYFSVDLLIMLDIGTIFITVLVTGFIRRGLPSKPLTEKNDFRRDFAEGIHALKQNKGVFSLVILSIALTFFIGIIQSLATPMMLSFADEEWVGVALSISAGGMLFSGLALSTFSVQKKPIRTLSIAMQCSGLFMVGFALRPNLWLVIIFGFLFFASLPFSNTVLDYLVRSNIDNSVQGRVWSWIGFVSQIGFLLAYALSGVVSDFVFTPMLSEGGILSQNIGKIIGMQRGSALLIILAGISLFVVASRIPKNKAILSLEQLSL